MVFDRLYHHVFLKLGLCNLHSSGMSDSGMRCIAVARDFRQQSDSPVQIQPEPLEFPGIALEAVRHYPVVLHVTVTPYRAKRDNQFPAFPEEGACL